MSAVFLTVLNQGLAAGWMILAVLLVRLLMRKAPRWLIVLLWGLVALRLLIPFHRESNYSLIPSAEPIPPTAQYEAFPAIDSGVDLLDNAVNPVLGESLAGSPADSVNPIQVWIAAGSLVWILGAAMILLYAVFSYLRLVLRLRTAVPIGEGVYEADGIGTPFLMGILHPRIYLPSGLMEPERGYMLAHEKTHLKRRDQLWKLLGYLLLSIYWFQPLSWIAYLLLCRDIELACDEKVIRDLNPAERKDYARTLLEAGAGKRVVLTCPVAFGENSVKQRIKNVLNYRKPRFWLVLVMLLLCLGVAFCFLTDPIQSKDERLQVFLETTITNHEMKYIHHPGDGIFPVIDYKILAIRKEGNTTTVYLWTLCEEYAMRDGKVVLQSGAWTPSVVTAKRVQDYYTLQEYWQPGEGERYMKDIREKVPFYLWKRFSSGEGTIAEMRQRSQKAAEDYFAGQQAEREPGQETGRLETQYVLHTKKGEVLVNLGSIVTLIDLREAVNVIIDRYETWDDYQEMRELHFERAFSEPTWIGKVIDYRDNLMAYAPGPLEEGDYTQCVEFLSDYDPPAEGEETKEFYWLLLREEDGPWVLAAWGLQEFNDIANAVQ